MSFWGATKRVENLRRAGVEAESDFIDEYCTMEPYFLPDSPDQRQFNFASNVRERFPDPQLSRDNRYAADFGRGQGVGRGEGGGGTGVMCGGGVGRGTGVPALVRGVGVGRGGKGTLQDRLHKWPSL